MPTDDENLNGKTKIQKPKPKIDEKRNPEKPQNRNQQRKPVTEKNSTRGESEILGEQKDKTFTDQESIEDMDFAENSPQTSATQQINDGNQFQQPRRTSKLSQLIESPKTTRLLTRNRYQPLVDALEEEKNTETEIANKTHRSISQKTNNRKMPKRDPKKPPPIVIKGKTNKHSELVNELRANIKKGFEIKYAPRSILLYIKDKSEYDKYKNKLIETESLEFHTYTAPEEKQHAFVLRGIQGDVDPKAIKEDLRDEYDIRVNDIYKMKTNYNSLYLVITSNNIILKDLQNNVKVVLHTKVQWERRRNERRIIQCKRCQNWGHAQGNCYRKPACVKCAGPHLTWECTRDSEEEPICINCKGNHTAANTICPVYQARIKKLENINPTTEDRYVEAPAPSINAWEQRRQQTSRRQQTDQVTAGGGATTAPAPRPPDINSGSTQASVSVNAGVTNEFSDLMKELNILNSMIDLKETIRALARLNQLIKNSKNALEAVQAFHEFSLEINTYNIFKH